MNKLNYGLIKLAEEASEVSKEAIKCLLFGIDNSHPYSSTLNIERLGEEIDDFMAVIAYLETEMQKLGYTYSPNKEYIDFKIDKLNNYYTHIYGDKYESVKADTTT